MSYSIKSKVVCVLVLAFALMGLACDRDGRREVKEKTAEARRKAHELGNDAKNEARDLKRRVNESVNAGTEDNGTSGAAQKIDRAAMIARVKAKLASDVGLRTVSDVDVDTNAHVITLRGNVSSEDQKRQAVRAVSEIPGVTKVVDELTISK